MLYSITVWVVSSSLGVSGQMFMLFSTQSLDDCSRGFTLADELLLSRVIGVQLHFARDKHTQSVSVCMLVFLCLC